MPVVSLDQTFVLSSDAVFRDLDGEGVILDLKSGTYFGLNTLGTRIWQLLQADPDLRRVFRILVEEYDVEGQVLERDLLELISRLADAGLGETQ
jgi:hypothetical protein